MTNEVLKLRTSENALTSRQLGWKDLSRIIADSLRIYRQFITIECTASLTGRYRQGGLMGNTEARDLLVEQISSASAGQGPAFPQVFVALSATTLSAALSAALSESLEIPDRGDGTYLATCWGLKRTGGYSVTIESAVLEGDQVTVNLALSEPFEDEITTQALTFPFAVAVLRDLDPRDKNFSFVGKLRWQIRHVDG